MNQKHDFGWLLHVIGGWVVLSLALFGFTREAFQHGSIGLSLHQWIEAMGWPVGGLLGVLAVDAVRWIRHHR